jgi:hypothetical protein
MLTLITLTGSRPVAWALCQAYMQRQTYAGPVRWLVVDDGKKPQTITFERAGWTLEVIRPKPFWEPGQNTQSRNLLAALEKVSDEDRLVFIEDDDWYSAGWLDLAARKLDEAELIGERFAFYYNVRTKSYLQLKNGSHASLCSTAIKGRAIAELRRICEQQHKFIDLALWRLPMPRRLFTSREVIGMKGLPGREGIGMGHQPPIHFKPDPSGEVLRKMIGADADRYFQSTLN